MGVGLETHVEVSTARFVEEVLHATVDYHDGLLEVHEESCVQLTPQCSGLTMPVTCDCEGVWRMSVTL
jgi:hypothetical protein